jgi:hypothetical protein
VSPSATTEATLTARVADRIAGSPFVTDVYEVGPDSVVVAVPGALADRFAALLDALAVNELDAILPAHRDDAGRYVYLVPDGDRLRRLTVALAAGDRAGGVVGVRLFHRQAPVPVPDADVDEVVGDPDTGADPLTALLITGLVQLHAAAAAARRGRPFAVHERILAARTAARDLVVGALAPAVSGQGWAAAEEALRLTPLGGTCLRLLAELALAATPRVPDEVSAHVDGFVRLARLAAPVALAALGSAADSYRRWLEAA